jgi:hypothetical protein
MKFEVDIKIGFEVPEKEWELMKTKDNITAEEFRQATIELFTNIIKDEFEDYDDSPVYSLDVKVTKLGTCELCSNENRHLNPTIGGKSICNDCVTSMEIEEIWR